MGRRILALFALAVLVTGCGPGPFGSVRPLDGPAAGDASAGTGGQAHDGVVCEYPDDPAAAALARRIIESGPRPAAGSETSLAWAIHDETTGVTCTLRDAQQFQAASVIKVATAAAWLWQVEQGRLEFTADEAWLAEAAITVSDNDSQELLWLIIGGAEGLAEFLTAAGMLATVPSFSDGDWGLTAITAGDQLRLLCHLDRATLLSREHSDYLLALMHEVAPEQFWGVSNGAPADAYISLKNGWLDEPVIVEEETSEETQPEPLWTHNSIGVVRAAGVHYQLVILSDANPGFEVGCERVGQVAAVLAGAIHG